MSSVYFHFGSAANSANSDVGLELPSRLDHQRAFTPTVSRSKELYHKPPWLFHSLLTRIDSSLLLSAMRYLLSLWTQDDCANQCMQDSVTGVLLAGVGVRTPR